MFRPVAVTVTGNVKVQGAYQLPDGASVQTAVDAAGGLYGGDHFLLVDALVTSVDGAQIRVKVREWKSTIVRSEDTVDVLTYRW